VLKKSAIVLGSGVATEVMIPATVVSPLPADDGTSSSEVWGMESVLDVVPSWNEPDDGVLNVATTLDWLLPVTVPLRTPEIVTVPGLVSGLLLSVCGKNVMLNGVSVYVVGCELGASGATWKNPSGTFEVVSTLADVIGTKLITFAPDTPSAAVIAPAVLYPRIESALVLVEALMKSPRAMTANRSPVHPCVMRIFSS
jgi:hypothetical protein